MLWCSVMSDCDPVDCCPSGSSVNGIFQARILEPVAISYFRGSSQPRDQAFVSYFSHIGRQIFTIVPPGKPLWNQWALIPVPPSPPTSVVLRVPMVDSSFQISAIRYLIAYLMTVNIFNDCESDQRFFPTSVGAVFRSWCCQLKILTPKPHPSSCRPDSHIDLWLGVCV